MLSHPSQIRDRSGAWMTHWREQRIRDLRPLVTPGLLAEHSRNPVGAHERHSAELTLVLNFVRSLCAADKEFIYAIEPFATYAIGRAAGRGSRPDLSDPERFLRREDAMHAIFLRRLRRFGLLDDTTAAGVATRTRA
ncbi:MAG: hypothetical protein O9284_03780 [Steroidobacteraceae bacterium]|nr:hypothetical protein [Steroidobacteraceae bacterium]